MDNQNLVRLASLIRDHREELLAGWRREVRQLPGAAGLDVPTINDQVPQLLDRLAQALTPGSEVPDTNTISAEHGLLRWQVGFDVTEVVAEYNILRQCLHDAAERDGISVNGTALHILNSVFDDAIGKAVKAFETMGAIELQHRHDEQLAFVLHDLRTPLEALSLATTLLERSLSGDQRDAGINAALSVLKGNINRLSDRVRHVLFTASAFRKSVRPEFLMLNLRAQVERVVRDLAPLAISAETEVRNEVDSQIEIYSDELLLAQILQNLLSNALKFTSKGVIEIGAQELDGTQAVKCWVKDSGDGIPATQIDKVFEKFETGSSRELGGMGLGLAIVKEIVELHKGEIYVESELRQGSTFTFVLPCTELP